MTVLSTEYLWILCQKHRRNQRDPSQLATTLTQLLCQNKLNNYVKGQWLHIYFIDRCRKYQKHNHSKEIVFDHSQYVLSAQLLTIIM